MDTTPKKRSDLRGFSSMSEVVSFLKSHAGPLYYAAPLDYWPHRIDGGYCRPFGRERVFVRADALTGGECDPFTADAGHLDRFLREPPKVPADFPVQPLREGEPATARATCGACGLSWDDGVSTSSTPVPSGRCPFEVLH